MAATLLITRPDDQPLVLPIGEPITIGRHPVCAVVVEEPTVSARHCVIWVEHGTPWLRDLASRGGTFVDGARVRAPVALAHGSEVRVGSLVARVQCPPEAEAPAPSQLFALRDLALGVAHVLHAPTFSVGPEPEADLVVQRGRARFEQRDGGLFIEGRGLVDGDEVVVGELTLRVEVLSVSLTGTLESPDEAFPYTVTVARNTDGVDALAVVAHEARGLRHQLGSARRAVLVYLLADKWCTDRDQGVPRDKRGWCADHDLVVGVWGRDALPTGERRLNVLLFRVREEIEAAGMDRAFLEKVRGYTRLRASTVERR